MKQPKPSDFRLFTSLPAELRRKIWESTTPRPGIHVFDVCVPSSIGNRRVRRAFEARDGSIRNEKQYNKYRDTVFLDVAETSMKALQKPNSGGAHNLGTPNFSTDPSMYRATQNIRSACSEANEFLQPPSKSPSTLGKETTSTSINSVYLPGRDKWIQYDNTSDVLFLRFGASGSVQNIAQQRLFGDKQDVLTFSSGISDVLEGIWSSELASTIWNARKIALDVADTWAANDSTPIMYEEVAYLSCCLQNSLEVLYLIDQDEEQRGKPDRALQASAKEGSLIFQLDSSIEQREPDMIHGVGFNYHETYDLERLGWSEDHPNFVLTQMFAEIIRSQQGEGGPFQGVRILECLPEEELEVPFQSLRL